MNKTDLKDLRPQIEAILNEHLPYTFVVGHGTYSTEQATFKLEIHEAGDMEEVRKKEFNKYCKLFGVTPEDYGRTMRMGIKRFKLIGFKLNAPKYPVLGEDPDGTVYKLTETYLKHLV